VASPFLIYSLLVNLMFGIANRLVQQIPVYFVSMPFVIAGGLALLYFTASELIRIFMAGYADLLSGG
jgi:flagellar biosynthetic protein FliR